VTINCDNFSNKSQQQIHACMHGSLRACLHFPGFFSTSSVESCCVHSAGGDLKRIAHYVLSVCVFQWRLLSCSLYTWHVTIELSNGRIRLSDPDQDSQWISVQIHLANRMTSGASNVSRIQFGFRFIVNPDPIMECAPSPACVRSIYVLLCLYCRHLRYVVVQFCSCCWSL